MTTTTAAQSYYFQIYTRDPLTLTEGWKIQSGFVRMACDRRHAVDKIRARYGDLMDDVIDCFPMAISYIGCNPVMID